MVFLEFPMIGNMIVIEDIAAICAEEAQASFCMSFDRLHTESKLLYQEFCFAAESIFTIR